MVYNWKSGSRFGGDAQKIGDEIGGLEDITPAAIVKSASRKKSALHECFTWDADEAAKQWNLHEARMLVCSIVTVVEVQDEPIEFRAFESVIVDEKRRYVGAEEIISNVDLRTQVLGEIRAGIGSLAQKARVYEHLAPENFKQVQERLEFAKEATVG